MLAAAVGYRRHQVVPFLRSLRNAGYSGDVVLFVDRRLKRELERDPVLSQLTLIACLRWLPMKLGFVYKPRTMGLLWSPAQALLWTALKLLARTPITDRPRERLQLAVAVVLHTPMEARFFRYLSYLRKHPHERVLLSDVRDVLFQGDPFAGIPMRGVSVSIETSSYTVGSEPHNASWLARVCGPETLRRIGGNRVANVGVTYGDTDAIINYLERLIDAVLTTPPRLTWIVGADTALHNMLVWTGQLGEVTQLPPLQSAVATLNGIDEAELRLDVDGRLLNRDGSLPNVLHQYDRQPSIRDKLLAALAS